MEAIHYVYEWVRPDHDVVFYVGKGSGDRAWDFNRDPKVQKHLMSIVKKLERNGMIPQVRILAKFVDINSAFDYEIERIAYWSPLGEIVNKTKGGDGVRGYKWTAEQKLNHYMKNPETRNDNTLFKSGENNHMFGIDPTEHPMYGKTHSNEQKEIWKITRKGVMPPNTKFSDEDVMQILNDCRTTHEICIDYNCCERTIRNIKKGRAYKKIYNEWLSSNNKEIV